MNTWLELTFACQNRGEEIEECVTPINSVNFVSFIANEMNSRGLIDTRNCIKDFGQSSSYETPINLCASRNARKTYNFIYYHFYIITWRKCVKI